MGDLQRDGIYRIPLNGGKDEKIIDTECPFSLTLDYTSRYVYWLDGCNYQIGTSRIDGGSSRLLNTGSNNIFPYGSSVMDNHVFYTQAGAVSSVFCLETKTAVQDLIYSERSAAMQDVQVVHSSNQLSGKPICVLATVVV